MPEPSRGPLRCAVHGVPIHNATLCPRCSYDLEKTLGDVPGLITELDVTLSRQDRIDRAGRLEDADPDAALPMTARIQRLAYNEAASDARDNLKATLVGWARDLHETSGDFLPADTEVAVARWLLARIDVIRQHPAADALRDEVTYAVDEVRRAVDRPAVLLYAGPCMEPTDAGRCETDLYAKPERDTVTCTACGAVHDLPARRVWLLAQAEDQLARAEEIARAAPTLGVDITPAAIRGYKFRGRIVAKGVDFQGRELFRVGDVLAVAQEVLARRVERQERKHRGEEGRRAS